MTRKLLSIISPAYNEEENILACYERVQRTMKGLEDRYEYEHLFGDNCSTDGTLAILRELARQDARVKVLTYSKNFGAEKNGLTLLRASTGEVVVPLPVDCQEPPEMIPVFLERWESGFELVCGVYESHETSLFMRHGRRVFYRLANAFAEEELPRNYNGFGAIDRRVADEVLRLDDQNPYGRGLLASVGFRRCEVPYLRELRQKGRSKHGIASLLGLGFNAIISNSLVPLRLATWCGMGMALLALLLAVVYGLIKIFFWNIQAPGATTVIVLIFFFSGVQLFFLGILGEYIGAIHAQVRRKPFVIIREKINFDA